MLPQILFFHRNKVITSIREPSRTSRAEQENSLLVARRAEQALPGSFTSGEKGLLARLLGSFGSFMMLASFARLVANLAPLTPLIVCRVGHEPSEPSGERARLLLGSSTCRSKASSRAGCLARVSSSELEVYVL